MSAVRLPFTAGMMERIPEEPGVYLFFGADGAILYVGKARDLRARVRQYLRGEAEGSRPIALFLERDVRFVETTVTGTEKEALLLENTLIKEMRPRYNIRLRDDKTYFSLRIDTTHPFPRITIVRRRRRDRALYFGPYPSARECRRTLHLLGSIYPLRTCTDRVLANRVRPCISYEIGRCPAPCTGLIDSEAYGEILDGAIRFLRGGDDGLLARLASEMGAHAEHREYERAAVLRDLIAAVRETLSDPRMTRGDRRDADAIGIFTGGHEASAVVLHLRDGALAGSSPYTLRVFGEEPGAVLPAFLLQVYGPDRPPPAEVLLPMPCPDAHLVADVLSGLRGRPVHLLVPERGERRRFVDLALRNAEVAAAQARGEESLLKAAAEGLRTKLGLRHVPERIECLDISHLGGTGIVGSTVAFAHGRPDRARYRRYRIRSIAGQDDFAAVAEVVRRRLLKGLEAGDLPDLLVIDGGRGQLGAALEAAALAGVEGVDIVALAKGRSGRRSRTTHDRQERIWLPGRPAPVVPDPASAELGLLMRIRDEAHRFAVSYQRVVRRRSALRQALTSVPGVGEERARALLRRFGSAAAVLRATPEDLATTAGIGPEIAGRIRAALDQPRG